MFTHLIAVLGLATLVAGWFLLSRWIARSDPELPGINRRCGGCGGGAKSEGKVCRRACANKQRRTRSST
ncbi:MAG: hypothetical protein KC503_45315 [Myxococcales bacterium]|nr:hypothetical protein [Myxococcales bacterium]